MHGFQKYASSSRFHISWFTAGQLGARPSDVSSCVKARSPGCCEGEKKLAAAGSRSISANSVAATRHSPTRSRAVAPLTSLYKIKPGPYAFEAQHPTLYSVRPRPLFRLTGISMACKLLLITCSIWQFCSIFCASPNPRSCRHLGFLS